MVVKEKDYQGGGADRPDRIHQVGNLLCWRWVEKCPTLNRQTNIVKVVKKVDLPACS